ncbi:MAG TPA: Gfo/Idh/MocA family oxidoreductase [Saprospiraceae bacterium]|nr:Gfo/Idh/MocA family oxidoreductase [Saprospiraceae bacterium]HNT22475.1 Gfo/Idh/MocA family oxidoreductase [Saprospiraceae bacterium]
MNKKSNRRSFFRSSLGALTGMALVKSGTANPIPSTLNQPEFYINHKLKETIRFSAIGLNHGHIYGQTNALLRAGGELVSFYTKETDLAEAFLKRFPQARLARSEDEILEDQNIKLVLSASIPLERAPLGIRVMEHGKDFMADKPGIITLEQLAEVKKVQKKTGRIYSIMYSERFENRATVKAGELVQAGAIGQVVQTIGLGPHRMNIASRPPWFFDKKYYGGIICDIGSHQCDQFLYFTGSTKAEIVSSQVGNVHYTRYPEFEDFGDMTVRGNKGTGYIRVDWFTPDGLATWGDGRLTILGTEGYIDIRKNIDIGGKPGGSHLFLVDKKQTQYVDCSKVELPYGAQLIQDVLQRTETAMSQEHCFLATEIALRAQKEAGKLVIEQ